MPSKVAGPPDTFHRPDLESAVIGAALLGRLPPGTEVLAPDDFSRPEHAVIWRAILEVAVDADGFVDPLLVTSRLGDNRASDRTMEAKREAEGNATGAANVAQYAEEIRELAIRRRARDFAAALAAAAAGGAPADELETRLRAAAEKGLGTAFHPGALTGPAWLEDEWRSLAERKSLADPPADRKWLLRCGPDVKADGMVVAGRVGLLAAAGGSGKSAALVQLALSLATGKPWLGEFGIGHSVGKILLALGEEDAEEIHRRLYWAAKAMQLVEEDLTRAADRIVALPLMGREVALTTGKVNGQGSGPTELVGHLLAKLKTGGDQWAALILDPLSRFAGPDVEIDNAAATRMVQVLERLTEAPGNPAVFVAHHTTKAARKPDANEGQGTSVRGASGLVDGVRWVASLEPLEWVEGCRRMVKFRVEKSNYAPFPDPVTLAFGEGGALRLVTEAEVNAHHAAAGKAKADGKAKKDAKKTENGGGGSTAADAATPASRAVPVEDL